MANFWEGIIESCVLNEEFSFSNTMTNDSTNIFNPLWAETSTLKGALGVVEVLKWGVVGALVPASSYSPDDH